MMASRNVEVTVPRAALEAIYDECDRYDHDETGGRLLGTFAVGRRGKLSVEITGIIEPGPAARRTPTSFFQDGEYQERVFRNLEDGYPEIEHLGNWHTHHVNGYPTLSSGDRQTYHRIVNHELHNSDFFYALLVTARNAGGKGGERYQTKHFIFRRGQPGDQEVPASAVKIVDRPIVWPVSPPPSRQETDRAASPAPSSDQRARDNEFFRDFQPSFRPFQAKASGNIYWRGQLALINETSIEVVIAEMDDDERRGRYGALFKGEVSDKSQFAQALPKMRFRSAIDACLTIESALNREIYRACEADLQAVRGRRRGDR
ncbi:MAG: hypothetical protein KF780_12520 [Sphingomonas sp.]|nr:hypothetical protein [Sphingomonas sp.]